MSRDDGINRLGGDDSISCGIVGLVFGFTQFRSQAGSGNIMRRFLPSAEVHRCYYALPCEFLTGLSAASGIALINSFAHLGAFVGPSMVGAITQKTGSLYSGLALAGKRTSVDQIRCD